MRIAVVGAGALGLYYGAMLQRSGEDVHFLLRSDYDAITVQGIKVFSTNGDFTLPQVHGYHAPQEIGVVDLVLVGLKTFANNSYSELVAPLVDKLTQIVTLQNGLGNEETLAGLFGAERVIGGVAFLCANRGKPGEVHHTGPSRIVLGEPKRRDRARLEQLTAMFIKTGVECRITEDLRRARWEKLVWNIPFNGLCALLLQPVNKLLKQDSTRALVRALMLEVIAAANAQNLSKPIDEGYADRMVEFTDNMGEYRPSMQIDREMGRQLELTAIFKIPLEYGQRKGIPMPRVEMLLTLLEQTVS